MTKYNAEQIKTEMVTVPFSFQPGPGDSNRAAKLYYAYANPNGDSDSQVRPADIIAFTGFGHEERTTKIAAKKLVDLGRRGVILVGGLPFWRTDPSSSGFNRLVEASTAALMEDMIDRKLYDGVSSLDDIGESQGAYTAIKAAEANQNIRNINIMQPIGFRPDMTALGFMGGMAKTGLQDGIYSSSVTPLITGSAVARLAQDFVGSGGKGLGVALGFNAVPNLERLIGDGTGRQIDISASRKDRVFPYSSIESALDDAAKDEEGGALLYPNIKRALGDHSLRLLEMDGPHASFATDIGSRRLVAAVDRLRAKRAA
ncbi:MAG: hypothetical protein ABI397_03495 [Candidatus Saccharimonas sp.]